MNIASLFGPLRSIDPRGAFSSDGRLGGVYQRNIREEQTTETEESAIACREECPPSSRHRHRARKSE